jgi:hypothetical protein
VWYRPGGCEFSPAKAVLLPSQAGSTTAYHLRWTHHTWLPLTPTVCWVFSVDTLVTAALHAASPAVVAGAAPYVAHNHTLFELVRFHAGLVGSLLWCRSGLSLCQCRFRGRLNPLHRAQIAIFSSVVLS